MGKTYAMVSYRIPRGEANTPENLEAFIVADDEVIGYSRKDGHFTVSKAYYQARTVSAHPTTVALAGLPEHLESLGYYLRPMPPNGIPWHRVNGWRA